MCFISWTIKGFIAIFGNACVKKIFFLLCDVVCYGHNVQFSNQLMKCSFWVALKISRFQDFISLNVHKAAGPLYNYNILIAAHIRHLHKETSYSWHSYLKLLMPCFKHTGNKVC